MAKAFRDGANFEWGSYEAKNVAWGILGGSG
jgi:hypothetical protein